MTIPEQEGRPVWEPLIIALSLTALLAYDWTELQALLHGRAPLTMMARAALELGAAAMMAWGLFTSLYRAARWTPGANGEA
jgi:hypothetical protein